MICTEQEIFEQSTREGVNNAATVWNAIYTRPRHEKVVSKQLAKRHIEVFLPTYGELHRWKDRRKMVFSPLFPGYLFVRILRGHCLPVLQVAGVIRFVGFNGSPAELPDAELQALRAAIAAGSPLGPHRYLKVGKRVRVCSGPLQNAEGVLVRKKSGHRLILSLDLIQRSVAVEVDAADVVPVSEIERRRLPNLQRSVDPKSPWVTASSIH